MNKKGGYAYDSKDNAFRGLEGQSCNAEVRNQLLYAISLSDKIRCVRTPDEYFKKLYKLFIKEELKITGMTSADSNIPLNYFLHKAECYLSNELFRRICSKLKKENVLSKENPITINEIKENDVLSIACPTLISEFHFITAVVNKLGNYVTIYQSFGYRKSLHKKEMPLTKFKQYLNNMINALNEKNITDDIINTILDTEKKLFFIDDIESQLESSIEKKLIKNNHNEENDDEENDDEENDDEEELTRDDVLEEKFNHYKMQEFKILCYRFIKSNCNESPRTKIKSKIKKSKKSKTLKKTKMPKSLTSLIPDTNLSPIISLTPYYNSL